MTEHNYRLGKLYHSDCLDALKEMDAESVDLTVTSPPYDNLRDYEGYIFDFESIAKELYRVTKQGGVVVWVVGDQTINGSETGTSFRQALYFKEIGFNLLDTMIYERAGVRFPDSNRYDPCFEFMFVFTKNKHKIFNPIKDKMNIHKNTKVATISGDRQRDGTITPNSAYRNNPNKLVPDFSKRTNIWRYKAGNNLTTKDDCFEHPAMFPEKLANDHIISWSNPGDLVLDPMCGSGTTCKMAMLQNRRFIGIDISEKYIEIARKRIKDYENDLVLDCEIIKSRLTHLEEVETPDLFSEVI